MLYTNQPLTAVGVELGRPVEICPGHTGYLIDDVLLNPERMVDLAVASRGQFKRPPANGYPGLELWMADDFAGRLDDFFRAHIRRLLGGRRTLAMSCRLSMVTFAPHELEPRQWTCHQDRAGVEDGQRSVASVLYLFHDSQLGGTSFYRPRKSPQETARLVQDACKLSGPEFQRRWGIAQGYMSESNEYFEHMGALDARWNRMVFYDGTVFHSGDIGMPHALSDDPRAGRLTLNGFFTCTQAAS